MVEPNKVVEQDCFAALAGMPEQAVEIVLTDPPRPDVLDPTSDSTIDSYAALYVTCKKARAYVIFFWNPENVPPPPHPWFEVARHVWCQPNSRIGHYELVIVWGREPRREIGRVFSVPVLEFRVPGTWKTQQKPVQLLRNLLELYTKEGDTVLDVFAGRGTVLLACLQSGRRCIAIDHNPACSKIDQEWLLTALQNRYSPSEQGHGSTIDKPSLPEPDGLYVSQRPFVRAKHASRRKAQSHRHAETTNGARDQHQS